MLVGPRSAPLTCALWAIGFTATASQVLVIRELLVVFHGNELFLGIILGTWLLLEAVGSYAARTRAERTPRHLSTFIALQSFVRDFFSSSFMSNGPVLAEDAAEIAVGEEDGARPIFTHDRHLLSLSLQLFICRSPWLFFLLSGQRRTGGREQGSADTKGSLEKIPARQPHGGPPPFFTKEGMNPAMSC